MTVRATSTLSMCWSCDHFAHLWQECHNSKSVIFQEKLLKVLKCYNFLWVQRRHNCSPAASFVNRVMILYLLKVHLQTFLSIPVTKKYQILSCDTFVANKLYVFQSFVKELIIALETKVAQTPLVFEFLNIDIKVHQ